LAHGSKADPTGTSLVQAWQEASGKRVGISTMHRALNRLKLSYKKRAAGPASKTKPSGTLSVKK
jgi:transposase